MDRLVPVAGEELSNGRKRRIVAGTHEVPVERLVLQLRRRRAIERHTRHRPHPCLPPHLQHVARDLDASEVQKGRPNSAKPRECCSTVAWLVVLADERMQMSMLDLARSTHR
ncbi:MAG: hypothetical protein OXI75_12805 [Rhodospirillales bacterium]|nr:hypothetical protein [Rhodospirillales bacterium]